MRTSNFIHSMKRDERGVVLPLFALFMFFFLVLFIGVAFDLGRQQIVQAKIKNALDAAALATASVPNEAERQAEAQAYFDANFPVGYMRSKLEPVQVKKLGENEIALSVDGTMDTTFLKYGSQGKGFDELNVGNETEVAFVRAVTGFEMALVMDTTGSMGGAPLADLKKAINGMLDAVYDKKTELDNVYIGLVPFSMSVNADGAFLDIKNIMKAAEIKPKNNWLRERAGKDDAGIPFEESEAPVDINNDASKFGYITSYTVPMTPLQKNVTAVKAKVAAFRDNGYTNVVPGTLWGWRMLSPQWRGLWAHVDPKLPLDYGTPNMKKVMVVMTDGESNTPDYNTNDPTPKNKLDAMNKTFVNICTNAKNKGVEIYTVAFRLKGNAGNIGKIKTALRNCASNPGYFFDSTTGAKLILDFKTIGQSLGALRISK